MTPPADASGNLMVLLTPQSVLLYTKLEDIKHVREQMPGGRSLGIENRVSRNSDRRGFLTPRHNELKNAEIKTSSS